MLRTDISHPYLHPSRFRSQERALPVLPSDLHNITLFMRESHLAVLVEADVFAVAPQPVHHQHCCHPILPPHQRQNNGMGQLTSHYPPSAPSTHSPPSNPPTNTNAPTHSTKLSPSHCPETPAPQLNNGFPYPTPPPPPALTPCPANSPAPNTTRNKRKVSRPRAQ